MGILQLRDHPSPHRKWILRWMFRNYPDLLRFYIFGGKLSRIPVIGPLLARPMFSAYGDLVHGGVAVPLSEINEVIDQARDIVVGECPCRALVDACDHPRWTCMKVNTAGEVLLDDPEVQGRRVSHEEAKAIAAECYSQGMLLQLEWCINPFHYDICCCCECCCVSRHLRFRCGIKGAVQAGPYLPRVFIDLCTECRECVSVCPADAISVNSAASVDIEKCIGCGLCQSVCPASAIEMKLEREFREKSAPSSFVLFMWWVAAIFLLAPEVILFKIIRKIRSDDSKPNLRPH